MKQFVTFLIIFSVLFFKMELTICQIYWIPDLQLLKLVCFMVANTWEQKYKDFKMTFFDNWSLQAGYF